MLAQTRESIGEGGGRPLQAHRLHRGRYRSRRRHSFPVGIVHGIGLWFGGW
jgi:hypothetical protein